MAYHKLPDEVDFNYHVKPILSDKCFACHGPDMDNQKAGLRLDVAEDAYAILESGLKAISPKNLKESEVFHRIFSEDAQTLMPPPEFKVTLNNEEKAIITKWIEQGAQYKPHWSFIKPEQTELPKVKNDDWINNTIDYFVANKLEASGLSPSKKASKETLVRRLSFTLTGLPPSLQQIEEFVNDTSETAYENLVDELLASPAYGERMAADWMDVARYADSDGYLDDKHRDFSPYRDWVIDAFNKNMSYKDFASHQLAGDLFPNATIETILPTAFNRLHKKNSEAGIVYEEFRAEYVADRTATVSKAFLGLTVECARCHDHKYDPISQKDHYKLSAFFNSTNEMGTAVYGPDQTPGPSLLLTTEEQEQIKTYLERDIETTNKNLITLKNKGNKEFVSWLDQSNTALSKNISKSIKSSLAAHYPLNTFIKKKGGLFETPATTPAKKAVVKSPEIKTRGNGKALFLNDYTNLNLPRDIAWFDHTDPFSVNLSVYPDRIYEDAMVFNHCEGDRLGLKGYSLHLENNHLKFIIAFSWPTNAIQVKSKLPLSEKEWANVTIAYDGSGKAEGIQLYKNGKAIEVDIEIDNLYKSIIFKSDIHTYGFRGFIVGRTEGMRSFVDGGIDDIKIFNRALTNLEVQFLKDKQVFQRIIENKTVEENRHKLEEFYFANLHQPIQKEKEKLRSLKKELTAHVDSIPEIMVLGDLLEPRKTFVLDRGQYDSPTEEVFPGVPDAILPFNDTLPKNRLGLVNWLFDDNNPLTARVFVNRIWQMHFGKGIVATSDDFGNQGSLPSHPELLGWLAVDFMESGWDIKALHKKIVMSATYQQSSKADKNLLEIDSENVLLARGPNFRLPAEMIRDNALAISGLMSPKIGGSSVYPYQPKGLWDELSNKKWRYKYLQESGEGLYRRSLYTIWKRTSPPPSMTIFDVGDRGVCAVKRRQTSTPLQALVLLNDPQFIEAGRVLATKLIDEHQNDTLQQLQHAFKLSTGRTPEHKELELLQNFYKEELNRFLQSEEEALAYLNIGDAPVNENIDTAKTAALATVINGIMNTTDAYTLR
ncbi:MAG: DUF1553 domain-containing protein [Jejuia sp.]